MPETFESIRAKVEDSIASFKKSTHPFAWIDDWCVQEPWSYYLHVGWVGAWNDEERTTPPDVFIRRWMTDEHLADVLRKTAALEATHDQP